MRYGQASTHSPRQATPAPLPGAKPAEFPGFIEPCLPILERRVPSGERWVHEVKHDGYRVQGHLVGGVPKLIIGRCHEWTHRMSAIAAALAEIPRAPSRGGWREESWGDFSALEVAPTHRGRRASSSPPSLAFDFQEPPPLIPNGPRRASRAAAALVRHERHIVTCRASPIPVTRGDGTLQEESTWPFKSSLNHGFSI